MLDNQNTPTQGLYTSQAQVLINRRNKTLLPNGVTPTILDHIQPSAEAKAKPKQNVYINRDASDLLLLEGDVRMKPFQANTVAATPRKSPMKPVCEEVPLSY